MKFNIFAKKTQQMQSKHSDRIPMNDLRRWTAQLLGTICIVGLMSEAGWTQGRPNLDIKVGIVQRFGEKPTDMLTIAAPGGDRLTLRFQGSDGNPKTVTTNSVNVEILREPLPQPVVEERVVLSTHRSFESAEDNANLWRDRGIEVEIAQPDRWQVWAKRDIYNTPLLRRLLLESLQSEGNQIAFIDTKVVREDIQPTWVVDGYRYHRKALDISAGTNVIQVKQGKNDRNGIIYGGNLRLQPNAYGTFTLVNQVPIETYLRGVVPHEVGEGAPDPAVEAQAILARTYALRNLRRFTIDGYEMCADTQCQVYKGLTDTWEPADAAIAATKNLVLTYEDELADALYSSTSGGITAPFSDVWNGPDRPYLRAVVDSVANIWNLSANSLATEENFRRFMSLKQGFNEETWDLFRWREDSSLAQINEYLRRYLQEKKSPLANFQTVQQMQIVERSPAGRVLKMVVRTNLGEVEIERDDIRRAFYAPWSTLFYIQPMYAPDQRTLTGYTFIGGGFGHGVGMSQTGAHKLGRLGWSSDRILSFYYPGTEIQPISESIVFWRDPHQGEKGNRE